MSKPKMALCVAHFDLNNQIDKWRPFLVDRAVVDDKDNLIPEIKQIIPYVTFTRHDEQSGEMQFLTYSRGKGGAEARLHAKRSIGIGGHVDTLPPEGVSLVAHLINETMREIYEELPGMFTDESTQHLQEKIGENLVEDLHYIDVRTVPVDSVHLGLSILISLDHVPGVNLAALGGEDYQVEDLRWENVDSMSEASKSTEYEGWSRYVIWYNFTNDFTDEAFNEVFDEHDDECLPRYTIPFTYSETEEA